MSISFYSTNKRESMLNAFYVLKKIISSISNNKNLKVYKLRYE